MATKFKTLNNRLSRFIIENAVYGTPKFTFIRLYNAMKDKQYEFDVLVRLFNLAKSILIEFHSVESLIDSIDDCPVSVRLWLSDFRKYLIALKGGVENV